jgi:MoaA/NifB/PqqE/SkfB family radical SAM enzyme
VQVLDTAESEHLFLDADEDLPLDYALVAVTQRCNLRCPMCTLRAGAGRISDGHLGSKQCLSSCGHGPRMKTLSITVGILPGGRAGG